MATKSIEERAKEIINKKYSGWDFELKRWATECCVETATEQDTVARKDERERCIKAAQIATCKCCISHHVGCTEQDNCQKLDKIRKAIEKGGKQ